MTHPDPDFAFEPIPGLPEALPAGERLLWQGAPDPIALAVSAFRIKWIAAAFGVLSLWRVGAGLHDGETAATIAWSVGLTLSFGLASIGVLLAAAALIARGTVYSVTTRRLVVRHGVAMPMAINVPFSKVDGAALAESSDGTGSVAFQLAKSSRASFLALWPHVRPGRLRAPEPMLRAVPDAARVARLVGSTLAAAAAQPEASTRVSSPPARPEVTSPRFDNTAVAS
jgi:hypothetical protein